MNITIKDLLDSGVHFGHQLRRYNPKSKKFVYDNRHGLSIIDLEKTYAQLVEASQFIEDIVASGKEVLFVATKKQAQEIVREAAVACEMPFAVNRWMGGTLTNYATIKRSLEKYKKYLAWEADGTLQKMHNKEAAAIRREMSRMNRNFEGILNMKGIPAALFIVDTKCEQIAVAEAQRLKIPVVGLVDTNADPTQVEIPIPGNDDSIKSIRVVVEVIMDAVQAGLARRETKANVVPRTVAPAEWSATSTVTEEQLPPVQASQEDAEIPETFSSES